MSQPQSSPGIFDHLKNHGSLITGVTSAVSSLVLAIVIGFGNMRSSQTHATDIQNQQTVQIEEQGKQIKVLQDQVSQTAAIISAINQFKIDTGTRLDHIEAKIDQELKYHRR